jgi:hypothetical protein
VYYRNGCIKKTRHLRIRPVPEMETCLVYTPKEPNLYTLNATAWLVLELCDGRPWRDLEHAFYRSVEPLMSTQEAAEYLAASVIDMIGKSIVEVVPKVRPRRIRSAREPRAP